MNSRAWPQSQTSDHDPLEAYPHGPVSEYC